MRRLRFALRDFAEDRQGAVAVIFALSAAALCATAALAVDLGSIALDARRLQGAADLAAMSGARDIAKAEAAARATAVANVGAQVGVAVTTGAYTADRTLAPTARFAAGGTGPNAIRVTLSDTTPLFFGKWILQRDSVQITRTATAAAAVDPPRAAFSIGSRLASLDGGVANQLLSALTGSSVSLTALDYRSLASTDVNLLAFSNALSTDLGLTVGDYNGLFSQQVDAGRALRVLNTLAGGQSSSALSRLASASTGVNVTLSDLIGVSAASPQGLAGALDVSVSALDLATAMLEVGGGDHQLALGTAVPAGLADLKISVAIGGRAEHSPWLTVTDKGDPVIHTNQARIYLRATTSQKLSGLAQVNLPILIEIAEAQARLNSLACTPRSVTLGVKPGIAKASIGIIDEKKLGDFGRPLNPTPATLLSVLGLVTLTGSAQVDAGDQSFTSVRFTDAEIKARTVKSVQTTGALNGIVVSLLQKMKVDVQIIGLGLGLSGIVQALGVLLTPLGPVLDGVVNPVLSTLGLKFGEADVTVAGANCPIATPRPVLVG